MARNPSPMYIELYTTEVLSFDELNKLLNEIMGKYPLTIAHGEVVEG